MLDGDLRRLDSDSLLNSCIGSLSRGAVGMHGIFGMLCMESHSAEECVMARLALEQLGWSGFNRLQLMCPIDCLSFRIIKHLGYGQWRGRLRFIGCWSHHDWHDREVGSIIGLS